MNEPDEQTPLDAPLPGIESLPEGYRDLGKRLGHDLLSRRLVKQASHWARVTSQGRGIFRLERFVSINELADFALRVSGLRGRAFRNFLDVQIVEQHWHLPNLPLQLDGFRLLQLSDLHLDLDPALAPKLIELVKQTPHDAAVITGDYRNSTDEDYGPSLASSQQLIPHLGTRRYGILGNHDFLEITWGLEEAGLPILLNEHRKVSHNGGDLYIAGVDDPHFYQTHSFEAARQGIPKGACTILLCHTPEAAEEAAAHEFDLILCGHTHAGQLCLPGGRHLVVPVHGVPIERIKGRWKCGKLQGYTSRGTGSCGLSARLNCPPEITLHLLHPAK